MTSNTDKSRSLNGIGHILKAAGCDFALLDLEQSGFSFETVKSGLRYFEAADLPAVVRVPSRDYHHIARAMDMGAEGIMLPMVGTAREARELTAGKVPRKTDDHRELKRRLAEHASRAGEGG